MYKFLLLLTLPVFAQNAIVETIVVRVNNEIVTLSELNRSREALRQELQQKLSGMQLTAEMAAREKNVLRDLIDNLLLIQKGKDLGIAVDTQVVKRMNDIRAQMALALVKAAPDQFTEVARFPAMDGKTWNHPVLVGDRLLVRNDNVMVAFRLSLERP